MYKQMWKKILSITLAIVMVFSFSRFGQTVFAGESLPMTGVSARKYNQPKFNGYRVQDIKTWDPETDPYAEYLVAKVPLQKRIDPFKPTQANPELESNAEIMLMQGDYGNVFTDPMMYNNTFGQLTLNFWQYADYWSPWHGSITASTPESLYDWSLELTDSKPWEKRYFEFGVLNIPNPAYTNAAHRNGVKSIACIYFDQAFRQGQTINELFVQDENGKFPVAEKLIEMADYFGYDGYFFNAEEAVSIEFQDAKKAFLARLTEAGLYTQYYDENPGMNFSKANWLDYDIDGDGKKEKLQNSVFINYDKRDINQMDKEIAFMQANKIDPFKQAFYGVESNLNGFNGGNSSATTIPNLYTPGTKNLRASLALFTPSDYYQRGLSDDLGKKADIIQDPDYQWMISERERMFFSGVTCDPTDTGEHPGYSRKDVGVQDASGWIGVADFASERSVINGTAFHTNFNVGKGMQYFSKGKVSRDEQWTNISIQDILPTWQWWVDSDGNKIKFDFDYGEKYYTGATQFKHIGAYNGGASLVATGNLQKDSKNILHLYKTDLTITDNSSFEIVYNKPSKTDATQMSLVLWLKDNPKEPVYLPLKETGIHTDGWKKQIVDIGDFKGQKIAAMGLAFEALQSDVNDYQINIGEIRLKDGNDQTPEKPSNFKVNKIYTTDEYTLTWDLGSFDTIDRYDIYATFSDGEKKHIGSTFDDIYYIKSLNEKNVVTLELIAVGKDGSESTPAVCQINYLDKVSDLKADTSMNATNLIEQNSKAGIIKLTWSNPSVEYEAIEFTAKLINSTDDYSVTKRVEKGVNEVQIPFERTNGEDYEVSAVTILSDGSRSSPIYMTGKTKDSYSTPYDKDKFRKNGSMAIFWQPTSADWHYMYVKCNGKPLKFNSRFVGEKEYAWRATTYMDTMLPDSTGVLEIILEDYSGNLSEPTYINFYENPNQLVDETIIPDPVLRKAVLQQVGKDTVAALGDYESVLNLSNLNIESFDGLMYLRNVKKVDLSGCEIPHISKNALPPNIEVLILDNVKQLEVVEYSALSEYKHLKELSIKGCTELKVLNLNDTNLEKLTVSDISDYHKLVSLNMINSKFDMSEETPEKIFANAIEEQNKGKDDIVINSSDQVINLAKGKTIVESEGISFVHKLFDGETSGFYDTPEVNSGYVTVKLDSPQRVEQLEINYAMSSYSCKDFKLESSNDGVNWEELTHITDAKMESVHKVDIVNAQPASYYRFSTAASHSHFGSSICEIQLLGKESTVYQAGSIYSGQRPEIYYTYAENKTFELGTQEIDPMSLIIAETVRGTPITELQSASFLASDYNLDQLKAPKNVYAKVIVESNDLLLTIPTNQNGIYNVEYTKVDAQNPTGTLEAKTKVIIGTPDPDTPDPDTPDPDTPDPDTPDPDTPDPDTPDTGDYYSIFSIYLIVSVIILLVMSKRRSIIKNRKI